ncbi:MAG TPA: hypothetical protein VME23_07605 [Terracidiphilus sp.]|nr:hypothetical protein [Terracidiphilus sp.]
MKLSGRVHSTPFSMHLFFQIAEARTWRRRKGLQKNGLQPVMREYAEAKTGTGVEKILQENA